MKKILLLIAVAFMFASCNKCKECIHDELENTTYDNNGNTQTHGDLIMEVCRDNFETKDDFKSYIDAMEDADWNCKSDFWN